MVSGGVNTALTYGLYLFLLMFMPYQWSYSASYVTGIFLAYALNRFFVFKSHRGLRSVLLLPLIYLIQYSLSIAVVWWWVEVLGMEEKLAPLVAIAVMLPITFILSKFAFAKKSDER